MGTEPNSGPSSSTSSRTRLTPWRRRRTGPEASVSQRHAADLPRFPSCCETPARASIPITWQAFSTRSSTKAKGSGLGLAICKMIVDQHGGAIWAVSDDGGARFEIALPTRTAGAGHPASSTAGRRSSDDRLKAAQAGIRWCLMANRTGRRSISIRPVSSPTPDGPRPS